MKSFAPPADEKQNPALAKLGMYSHFALRTVESVGPGNGDPGLGFNWLVILGKRDKSDDVFEVRRDKILMQDFVKIAPITKSFTKTS